MRKDSRKYRLWIWFAVNVLRAPYTVDFTPPDSDVVVGIGFAWNRADAERMQANYTIAPPIPSRRQRRAINSAIKKAAKDNES